MITRSQHSQLILLLNNLAQELKSHQLRSQQTLSVQKLQNTPPFSCDTLRFEQWLQFIYIARLTILVAHQQVLPKNIAVVPMAEEIFTPKEHFRLLDIIADIDELLSGVIVTRTWRSAVHQQEITQ
jgi:dTDP-4-dehydrorhamnose 3,5-epimerase